MDPSAPPTGLRQLPAVETLRRVWVQNYLQSEEGARWRTLDDGLPPAAQFLSSPHDWDAHLGRKGSNGWVGYTVVLTETCEDDTPQLITQVVRTPAPTAEGAVTPQIHQALQHTGLLPALHLVDTAFLDAELLVTSRQEYDVELLGPTRRDWPWQAQAAQGFASADFVVDFDRCRSTCPAGKESVEWVPRVDKWGKASSSIRFSSGDFGACPSQAQCI